MKDELCIKLFADVTVLGGERLKGSAFGAFKFNLANFVVRDQICDTNERLPSSSQSHRFTRVSPSWPGRPSRFLLVTLRHAVYGRHIEANVG
jgi:hypothetical protein